MSKNEVISLVEFRLREADMQRAIETAKDPSGSRKDLVLVLRTFRDFVRDLEAICKEAE